MLRIFFYRLKHGKIRRAKPCVTQADMLWNLCVQVEMDRTWKVLAWSFDCLALGTWPSKDYRGIKRLDRIFTGTVLLKQFYFLIQSLANDTNTSGISHLIQSMPAQGSLWPAAGAASSCVFVGIWISFPNSCRCRGAASLRHKTCKGHCGGSKFLSKLSSLALQVAVTQQPLLSLPVHKVRPPCLSRRPCQRSLDEHSVDAIAMAALARPFPLSPLRQRPYGSEHFSRLHAREVFGLAAVLHGLGAVAVVLRDIA